MWHDVEALANQRAFCVKGSRSDILAPEEICTECRTGHVEGDGHEEGWRSEGGGGASRFCFFVFSFSWFGVKGGVGCGWVVWVLWRIERIGVGGKFYRGRVHGKLG